MSTSLFTAKGVQPGAASDARSTSRSVSSAAAKRSVDGSLEDPWRGVVARNPLNGIHPSTPGGTYLGQRCFDRRSRNDPSETTAAREQQPVSERRARGERVEGRTRAGPARSPDFRFPSRPGATRLRESMCGLVATISSHLGPRGVSGMSVERRESILGRETSDASV